MASWAVYELIGADFGDVRLTDRLIRLVGAVAERPEVGIPEACGKAGTKAAYRFLDNPRVHASKILAPHMARAAQRASEHAVVLVPQDTTAFSFNHHPATQGTGYISTRSSRGLLMHSAMLLSPEGTPLGILHHEVWARKLKDFGKAAKARGKPIEEKESRRWLTTVAAVEEALPDHPQVVVIGDQEADIFDLFAAPRRQGVDLLVRVCHSGRRVDHEAKYLSSALKNSPKRGQMTLRLPRADDRPTRQAVLTLRWMSLTVVPPRHHPQRTELSPLRLQFILAEEENPPREQKPVRWLLVTTLPVESLEDAVRCLRWYTYRWRIERLHFVLKSGCRIEQLQLETARRLQRAIACYLIVAWRLMWLMYESRQNPEATCAGILATHEWQALHVKLHLRQPLPSQPPTLGEAVRMIAELGGFRGRKHDGEPGLKTLWRGLRRLDDLSTMWQLSQARLRHGQQVLHVGTA